MTAKRTQGRHRDDAAGRLYIRTLKQLAFHDQSARDVSAMLRSIARWCGAQLAILMTVTAAEGALEVVEAVGRSAHIVAHHIACEYRVEPRAEIHALTVGGYSVLTAPLATPAGVAGFLAIGTRPARGSDRLQSQRLRDVAPLVSIAIELRALRGQPNRAAATLEMSHDLDAERRLSARERDVVALLLAGQSAKEASITLHLSPRTLETYLQRLKARYRQPSLHALLGHLIRAGLA